MMIHNRKISTCRKALNRHVMARQTTTIPWTNLAGPPIHQSLAVSGNDRKRRTYRGVLKVRLGHSVGRTYLIPELLIGVAGSRYFLPRFFSPPQIFFNVGEEGRHIATLTIDVGAPRARNLTRLFVTLDVKNRVLSYDDGAQLYCCNFEGPRSIAEYASGLCSSLPSGDYALRVYHHTTLDKAAKIRESAELWSSPWNLAGTGKLVNVAYGYLTPLSRIKGENDLRLIAMSSDGHIKLQTTSDRRHEEVLSLRVYRGNTEDRNCALAFDVPSGIIAPPHLLLHPNVGANPAYYEVVGSDIIRVGVKPAAVLQIDGANISVPGRSLKHFDYVVLGDAASLEGLAAPYEEEETQSVTHLEKLHHNLDFFQFWWDHQNTDQVAGRTFEPRAVEAT